MNDPLSEKIIGAAFQVYKTLGFGFLESVYEKSISIELIKLQIPHQCQEPIQVFYKEHVVGEFVCDLLIDNQLIVELKSVANLATAHEVQLVNYLVATKIDVGLLLNFGPSKVEIKRKYRTYKNRNETI